MYEIRLTTQAKRAYHRLDAVTKARVDELLSQLETGCFSHNNISALHGKLSGCLRYRMGKGIIPNRFNSNKAKIYWKLFPQHYSLPTFFAEGDASLWGFKA